MKGIFRQGVKELGVLALFCLYGTISFSQGVGIGVASPDGILHLDEGTSDTEFIMEKDATTRITIQFHVDGTVKATLNYDGGEDLGVRNQETDKDLIFQIDDGGTDKEIMRLDGSASSLGIGTATPDGILHVDNGASNTEVIIEKDDGTSGGIDFDNIGTVKATVGYASDEALHITNLEADADIVFQVDVGGTDTEIIRLDADVSMMGIGTASPDGLLTVEEDDGVNAADMIIRTTNTALDYGSAHRFAEGTNFQGAYIQYDGSGEDFIIGMHDADDQVVGTDQEVLRISTANGNVGILTTVDATEELEVNGTTIGGFGLLSVAMSKRDVSDDDDNYKTAIAVADPSDDRVWLIISDDDDRAISELDDANEYDPNDAGGGAVWTDMGQPDATARIMSVAVSQENMFAANERAVVLIVRMDDGNTWVRVTNGEQNAAGLDDTGNWNGWTNFGNPGM